LSKGLHLTQPIWDFNHKASRALCLLGIVIIKSWFKLAPGKCANVGKQDSRIAFSQWRTSQSKTNNLRHERRAMVLTNINS